ncbi:hypothetical protein HMPREF0043_02020 [Actinobaculum sp. oral taxon 183 str. F0552]|nr:hypothetical protein HMPREF0043_02020 [Actinobaculum sp. oral taxon 183 str. F0552]
MPKVFCRRNRFRAYRDPLHPYRNPHCAFGLPESMPSSRSMDSPTPQIRVSR